MTPAGFPPPIQSMLQALNSGETDAARAQAQAILQSAPGEPNASQVLAMLLLREGKAREALVHLEAADRAAPAHPPILNMMGAALKQLARWTDARAQFEQAIAEDGQFIDARLNLALLDLDEGQLGAAQTGYEAVLALQPENATAIVGRARAALALHDNETARDFAERALARVPDHELAALTLAVARMRLEDFEGVLEVALPLKDRGDVGPVNQAYAAGFAADALDRLGRYDEAFELYTQANTLQADNSAELKDVAISVFSPAVIERVSQALGRPEASTVPACAQGERMPVFLVGFPRSGTTLLEQILMSHPNIESFGEHAALSTACGDLYISEEAIGHFSALSEEGAAARRETYWQEVAKLGALGDDQVLLDKLPLNTVLLPAIAKVFPHAKILFALRDPRDVVLSCFQQRFGMNVAMYQLLALESAAQYYGSVMSLGVRARALYSFDLYEVRYEDVIADLEGAARRVLEFLGFDWDPAVMRYREGARARAIDTPSVAQVVEPVYTRGLGKWQNYEAHLRSVLGHLAPWVRHWGYTE